MRLGINFIAVLILGIIILVLLALFNVTTINSIVSKIFFGIDNSLDEPTKNKLLENFEKLKMSIVDCSNQDNNDCFCINQDTIFPTDYKLRINNNENIKFRMELLTDTGQTLGRAELGFEGCALLKDASYDRIDSNLDLVYGKEPKILYKRKKYDFQLDHVFYKKSNKVCVVEKRLIDSLDKDSICQLNQKT